MFMVLIKETKEASFSYKRLWQREYEFILNIYNGFYNFLLELCGFLSKKIHVQINLKTIINTYNNAINIYAINMYNIHVCTVPKYPLGNT